MKKIALWLVFAACCNVLVAQEPHTLDTIMGREPTYYYQYWFDSADFVTRKPLCQKNLCLAEPTEVAKYNYTDSTLVIVGIAAYSRSEYVPDPPLPCYAQCADTSFDNWYENLILYKPTDTGMVALASQTYNVRDTTRLMMLYDNRVQGSDSVSVGYYPIYEVYFDEPVAVTDSFYVATTNYHGVVDSATMTYPGPHAMSALYTPWWNNTHCYPQHYKSKGDWSNYLWEHSYADRVWLIFPIIDTTQPRCLEPLNLIVQSQDSNGVYLSWEMGENNRTWEVAYGRAEEDVDAYPTLMVVTPECTLTDLAVGVEYAARVRANCFDNAQYSGWSDTIHFTRDGNPLSISTVGDISIRLQPNPAHNEIVIHSEVAIWHIAIYDMQGHMAIAQSSKAKSVSINLNRLAKGNYVVQTTTTKGVFTSKLAIE